MPEGIGISIKRINRGLIGADSFLAIHIPQDPVLLIQQAAADPIGISIIAGIIGAYIHAV